MGIDMSIIEKIVETTRKQWESEVGMDDKALFWAYVVGMTLWAVVIGVLAFGLLG